MTSTVRVNLLFIAEKQDTLPITLSDSTDYNNVHVPQQFWWCIHAWVVNYNPYMSNSCISAVCNTNLLHGMIYVLIPTMISLWSCTYCVQRALWWLYNTSTSHQQYSLWLYLYNMKTKECSEFLSCLMAISNSKNLFDEITTTTIWRPRNEQNSCHV